jgi:hypothetical protein
MAKNFLRRVALQKKKRKLDASSRLYVFEMAGARLLKTSFSLCNKKRLAIRHMNRSLFPTTLSISTYDKGKYVRLRNYQIREVFQIFTPDEEKKY